MPRAAPLAAWYHAASADFRSSEPGEGRVTLCCDNLGASVGHLWNNGSFHRKHSGRGPP